MGLRYWTVLNKVEKIKHKYHIHFFRQPAHRELGRTLCRTRLVWTCSTRKHPWLWETPTDSKGKNNTASRLVKIINIFRLRHPHPTIPVRLIWQKLKRVGILGRQTQTLWVTSNCFMFWTNSTAVPVAVWRVSKERKKELELDKSWIALTPTTFIYVRACVRELLDGLKVWGGLSGAALNWFESCLKVRQYFVSVTNYTSELTRMTCGVPQGSILGPLLFGCSSVG